MMTSSTQRKIITNNFNKLLQYQQQQHHHQHQQQSNTNQRAEQHLASGKVKSGFTDFSINAIIGQPQPQPQQDKQDSQHQDSSRLTRNQGSTRKSRPKNFLCPTCKMAFSNNGQLKNHARIHTGERPFSCHFGDCDKSFTRNEELTRHKLIHSGLKPHACQVCGKRFGRKDHLKKHLRTHDARRNKHLRKRTAIIVPTTEQQQQQQQQVDHSNQTPEHLSDYLQYNLPFQQPPPPLEQLARDYINSWYNFRNWTQYFH